ncbi:hypothetical protein BaRGS_00015889, partial [Batillaria attramentaria]
SPKAKDLDLNLIESRSVGELKALVVEQLALAGGNALQQLSQNLDHNSQEEIALGVRLPKGELSVCKGKNHRAEAPRKRLGKATRRF